MTKKKRTTRKKKAPSNGETVRRAKQAKQAARDQSGLVEQLRERLSDDKKGLEVLREFEQEFLKMFDRFVEMYVINGKLNEQNVLMFKAMQKALEGDTLEVESLVRDLLTKIERRVDRLHTQFYDARCAILEAKEAADDAAHKMVEARETVQVGIEASKGVDDDDQSGRT